MKMERATFTGLDEFGAYRGNDRYKLVDLGGRRVYLCRSPNP